MFESAKTTSESRYYLNMDTFEKIVFALQATMVRPQPYGWFHLTWMALTAAAIFILAKNRRKAGEKQLNALLIIYAVPTLILEITKQVIWSYSFDAAAGLGYWDYQWYAAPFQLCTMPAYVGIIAAFLKPGKTKNALLSLLAYFTIWGSVMTFFIPNSCFVETIEVNIHTMWLHCGSLVVSVYLLMTGAVKNELRSVRRGFFVFLICAGTALAMDVAMKLSGVIGEDTFNMFYISPYFISSLPVFDDIQQAVPYVVFLAVYVVSFLLGALAVFLTVKLLENGLFAIRRNSRLSHSI
ncbi:MAG: hypothetical protein EOM14_00225 [Clostridia bacterium]|nr:hypothetical protein [Clostridia bacterium]